MRGAPLSFRDSRSGAMLDFMEAGIEQKLFCSRLVLKHCAYFGRSSPHFSPRRLHEAEIHADRGRSLSDAARQAGKPAHTTPLGRHGTARTRRRLHRHRTLARP